MNSQPTENSSTLLWLFRVAVWFCWLLGILAILVLFVLPVLANWALSSGYLPKSMSRNLDLLTIAQTWLMRIVIAIWIFFLGSCFASFLNVVAWRIPRGGSINGSSHCPDCNQRLKFQDNTPIIGWLRNGGRCSNCRLPIPVRYLLVEILLGSLFLLITTVQLILRGWNLPFLPLEKLSGFEHLIFEPKLDLIALTVYHLVLICMLFTFTLIKNETLKIPRGVWLVGVVLGLGMPLIWPAMNLVSWELGQTELTIFERGSFQQLMTLGLGLTVGAALGIILKLSLKSIEPEHQYVFQPTYIGEEVAGLSLIGLFLGWQSVLSVSLIAVLFILLVRLLRLRWKLLGPTGCLLFATLVHLLCWRISTDFPFWPSGKFDWFGWL